MKIAEMTASEAKKILTGTNVVIYDFQAHQIAILIERQQEEIKRLSGQTSFDGSQIAEYETMIRVQAAEIAKKDRMLAKAIDRLDFCAYTECPNDYATCVCADDVFVACWLAWLEKESEVQNG